MTMVKARTSPRVSTGTVVKLRPEHEAQALRTEIDSFAIDAPTGADPLDVSVATAARDERASMVRLHRKRMADIEGAIARIDDGTWGRCTSCQKPIPRARLQALPAAEQCVECASRRS